MCDYTVIDVSQESDLAAWCFATSVELKRMPKSPRLCEDEIAELLTKNHDKNTLRQVKFNHLSPAFLTK